MAGNTNILRILTQAIQEKRCVAIRCDGKSRLVTIEPHAVYTDDNSNIALDCYQKCASDEAGMPDGFWNTIGWRKINAVFWLNTFFSPRVNQGFVPQADKYRLGLVEIVDNGRRSKLDEQLLQNIESSIEQLLTSNPQTQVKH